MERQVDEGADPDPARRRREVREDRQGVERAPVGKRQRAIGGTRVGRLGVDRVEEAFGYPQAVVAEILNLSRDFLKRIRSGIGSELRHR